MYEFPLILVGSLMLVAFLLPRLSRTGGTIFLAVMAVPILFALYYMIITPGWQPGARRLGPPWNWAVFLIAAAAVLGGVALYGFGS
jgi:hypothetical protein